MQTLLSNAAFSNGISEFPVTDFQVNAERSVTMGSIGGNDDLSRGEFIGFNGTLVNGSGGATQLLKLASVSAPQTGAAVISADKAENEPACWNAKCLELPNRISTGR